MNWHSNANWQGSGDGFSGDGLGGGWQICFGPVDEDPPDVCPPTQPYTYYNQQACCDHPPEPNGGQEAMQCIGGNYVMCDGSSGLGPTCVSNPCASVGCGEHGQCVGGSCQCEAGYSGASCSLL